MQAIFEMLSYPFMLRAFIAGAFLSFSLALLGVPMVLKRYSMIGDGLSHVAFGALAVGSALHARPLTVSIPIVMLSAVFLLRLSESGKFKGDRAIALLSTSALAVGVTAVSVTKGMNVDVWNYLFGSVLSLTDADVVSSVLLAWLTGLVFFIFYTRIFSCTFDESFSAAVGIHVGRYNLIMALTTSLVIILGMRMVGTLLISSLIVFPTTTAMQVSKSFRGVVVFSGIFSVSCSVLGIALSYFADTPTGASIVLCNLALFLFLALFRGLAKIRFFVLG